MPLADFDTVIVGAGPAGSTTAYCLARAGLRVCIIDRKNFPRHKPCAGLMTWKTQHLLASQLNTPIASLMRRAIVTGTCNDFAVYHCDRKLVQRRLSFPFHLVDRASYDHYWLEKARAAGAKTVTGVGATAIHPISGRVELSNGQAVSGKMIVGADGAWSRVRRTIFPSSRARRTFQHQMAMAIETTHETDLAHSTAALYFGLVPWGYAWRFASRRGRIIGMAALRSHDSQSLKAQWRKFVTVLGDLPSTPLRGHPLPYGNFLETPGVEKVMLVGDACGLADPLLGEGIYYAHRSAHSAAAAILRGSGKPEHCQVLYRACLKRHIIRDLKWIKWYRTILFIGGRRRRYRGLRLFLRWFPSRLEAAIQGTGSFRRLFIWKRS